MDTDAIRWNERWTDRPSAEPSPPDALVASGVDLTETGRALDVACGLGGVAVWLAKRGFTVDAYDVSLVAIESAKVLAADNGVTRRCNAEVADLNNGLPSSAGDSYDVIACQRFRDEALYGEMIDRLAPGGLLIITVLSVVDRHDQSSPYLADPGELTKVFGDLDILYADEADGHAQLVARKPA